MTKCCTGQTSHWDYSSLSNLLQLLLYDTRSLLKQYFVLSNLCSDNADCDGSVMSAVWRMVAFQKTSSIYGELALSGAYKENQRRPHLRYNMKAVDIDYVL